MPHPIHAMMHAPSPHPALHHEAICTLRREAAPPHPIWPRGICDQNLRGPPTTPPCVSKYSNTSHCMYSHHPVCSPLTLDSLFRVSLSILCSAPACMCVLNIATSLQACLDDLSHPGLPRLTRSKCTNSPYDSNYSKSPWALRRGRKAPSCLYPSQLPHPEQSLRPHCRRKLHRCAPTHPTRTPTPPACQYSRRARACRATS